MENRRCRQEATTPPGCRARRSANATLAVGDQQLQGADAPSEHDRKPQGFSISISLADAAEAERIFAALADGGTVGMPIQETFWAPALPEWSQTGSESAQNGQLRKAGLTDHQSRALIYVTHLALAGYAFGGVTGRGLSGLVIGRTLPARSSFCLNSAAWNCLNLSRVSGLAPTDITTVPGDASPRMITCDTAAYLVGI